MADHPHGPRRVGGDSLGALAAGASLWMDRRSSRFLERARAGAGPVGIRRLALGSDRALGPVPQGDGVGAGSQLYAEPRHLCLLAPSDVSLRADAHFWMGPLLRQP